MSWLLLLLAILNEIIKAAVDDNESSTCDSERFRSSLQFLAEFAFEVKFAGMHIPLPPPHFSHCNSHIVVESVRPI